MEVSRYLFENVTDPESYDRLSKLWLRGSVIPMAQGIG